MSDEVLTTDPRPEERPFEEPHDWRFELGTDTSFTLSDEGEGSTHRDPIVTLPARLTSAARTGKIVCSMSVIACRPCACCCRKACKVSAQPVACLG